MSDKKTLDDVVEVLKCSGDLNKQLTLEGRFSSTYGTVEHARFTEVILFMRMPWFSGVAFGWFTLTQLAVFRVALLS